jgi:hypothetical protein
LLNGQGEAAGTLFSHSKSLTVKSRNWKLSISRL